VRNRVALTTAYAAGLRIGEVARLKVSSIDSKRMLLHIESGKGGRDRYAMLSPRLLEILRAYWKRARPSLWLFPGQEPGGHVSTGALQAACRAARKRARMISPGVPTRSRPGSGALLDDNFLHSVAGAVNPWKPWRRVIVADCGR
jgi:integrase